MPSRYDSVHFIHSQGDVIRSDAQSHCRFCIDDQKQRRERAGCRPGGMGLECPRDMIASTLSTVRATSSDLMRNRIVDFASMIKNNDASALVVGPEEWGWNALAI